MKGFGSQVFSSNPERIEAPENEGIFGKEGVQGKEIRRLGAIVPSPPQDYNEGVPPPRRKDTPWPRPLPGTPGSFCSSPP